MEAPKGGAGTGEGGNGAVGWEMEQQRGKLRQERGKWGRREGN